MKFSLHEIIQRSATAALGLQASNGAMPPGCNGPWKDQPTPVRNTGHWLITFLEAHRLTGRADFKEAAGRAADYLTSPAARPGAGAFWHLKNQSRPPGNGLIGQAWTIEGLGFASHRLERPELAELAAQVFLQHRFDSRRALWAIMDLEGGAGRESATFNQQLWFAAAGAALISENAHGREIEDRVLQFLNGLHEHIHFGRDGIFDHTIEAPGPTLYRRLRRILHRGKLARHRFPPRTRAVGYHSFNMYGLAMLKPVFPSHALWSSGQLDRMWHPVTSAKYDRLAAGNPFCFLYNPTGIEVAFALETFRAGADDLVVEYLHKQFSRCLDPETGVMNRGGAHDPVTQAARVYEMARLADRELSI